ncbi:MAG: hypothetical protein Q7R40_12090 [Phaeospirillum sp.]|nr:hypothetical protein [Phaeospirillum sp.]
MNMSSFDLQHPSIAVDIATDIEAAERELKRLLNLYVKFEAGWNKRFKALAAGGTDGAELVRLQEERASCEASLGIEAIVDRAGHLREARTMLSDLVGMAVVGTSQEVIAAHAEHFFGGGGRDDAGPIGLETWWLAGSLLDWVSQPVSGSDIDMDVRITWRDLERLAAPSSG